MPHFVLPVVKDAYLELRQPAIRFIPINEIQASCLPRLPLFYDLTELDQMRIVEGVTEFLHGTKAPKVIPAPLAVASRAAR